MSTNWGLLLLVCLLNASETVSGFDCSNHPFEESDVYECDSGECILRGFRCDGSEDCEDGSDEGAENCGDIIGAVIGGVLGGIIVCCICPCIVVCFCIWLSYKKPASRQRWTLQTQPVRNASRGRFSEPTVTQVQYNIPQAAVSTASPQLHNADAPPPYPASDFVSCPAYPPVGFEMNVLSNDCDGDLGGCDDDGNCSGGSCGGSCGGDD